jgi:uncharacterized membrane protein YedE/YeeE
VKAALVGLLAGLLFGSGLVVSRMTDPAVVLAFLDVTGAWNPALLGVMGGAASTFGLFYWIATRRGGAVLAPDLRVPRERPLDARLFIGTALFGVGWGLAGLCPGPALTALAAGTPATLAFAAAMLGGIALSGAIDQGAARSAVSQSDSTK